MCVFNIKAGVLHTIKASPKTQEIEVLMTLAEITGLRLRNRVFVYDIETQGLERTVHHIIQRHVVDYATRSVVSSGFLNFPINDFIRSLTHITEQQLASGDPDYTRIKSEFARIAETCEKPVLIAHNGMSFDHLFLQNKKIISSQRFLLADSKAIIAQHYHKKGNL